MAGNASLAHGCILRALCEMAETPGHENGLLGDAFNLLTIPAHVVDEYANDTTAKQSPLEELSRNILLHCTCFSLKSLSLSGSKVRLVFDTMYSMYFGIKYVEALKETFSFRRQQEPFRLAFKFN